MTDPNTPTPSDQISAMTSGANKGNVQLIYLLYFVGVLVGLTAIIGLVMAYLNKAEAPDWLKTHYVWLIRTFWIGLLFGLISAVLTVVLIGVLLALATLVWLIVRLVQGMSYLGKNQPIPNPQSWMLAS